MSILAVNYDELARDVLELLPEVRFAGVVNSKGEMVAGGKKEGVEQYLNGDQVKMSIHYALKKRDLYTNLAYKIGSERSSITEYGKVSMISIPINQSELFLASTEPRADYAKIIDFVHSKIGSQN